MTKVKIIEIVFGDDISDETVEEIVDALTVFIPVYHPGAVFFVRTEEQEEASDEND